MEYLAYLIFQILLVHLEFGHIPRNILSQEKSKMKSTFAILLAVLAFSASAKVPTISSDYDDFIDDVPETTIEPTKPPTEPPTNSPTEPSTEPPTEPPTNTPVTTPATTGAASISLTTFVFLLSAISLKL
jgi:hypothetical protein